MMGPVGIPTTSINHLDIGCPLSIPKIFKIKSMELAVGCRERTTSNCLWVKYRKWKNHFMMNTADGLRFSQAQPTRVGLRLLVQTIKANRIWMLTKAAISIIQTQLLTKATILERVHRSTNSSQRKKKKIYFYTLRARAGQPSIALRTSPLF